jgi:adenylate cyclase
MTIDLKPLEDHVRILLDKSLPAGVLYHNMNHASSMYRTASLYAGLEGVKNGDRRLLLTTALVHELGFVRQYEDNKDISVQMAKEILLRFAYSDGEIEEIGQLIRSTQLPHEPRNLLQQILCDSEFDHFGTPLFLEVDYLYRKELELCKGEVHSDLEWYRAQLEFLSKQHRYFTRSAKNIRDPGKRINMTQLKGLIRELEQVDV